MNSKKEVLELCINRTKVMMLLANEVEYKKHNGIEYRMINEDIVEEAMTEYRYIGERETAIGFIEWVRKELLVHVYWDKREKPYDYEGKFVTVEQLYEIYKQSL